MPILIQGLLLVLLLSALGGWFLSARKSQETAVKIMMFIGYFWLLAFIQLLLFGLAYYLRQHFFSGI